MSFNQDAAWIDPRLVYENLKRNTDLNVLSEDETKAIWTPQIVFYNTKGKEESVADHRSILSVIPVEDFKFKKTDQTSFENINLKMDPMTGRCAKYEKWKLLKGVE